MKKKDEELCLSILNYCMSIAPWDIYDVLNWLEKNAFLTAKGKEFQKAFVKLLISSYYN